MSYIGRGAKAKNTNNCIFGRGRASPSHKVASPLPKFFLLSMVPSYHWAFYNRNLFKLFPSKTVKFFLFLLFFNSKHKRKLMVLNNFGRKKLKKGYSCKILNNTRVPLIIKKRGGTIDKVTKYKGTIDNFSKIII